MKTKQIHQRQRFVPNPTAAEQFIEQLHIGWPTLFEACGDRNLITEMYECADPFLDRLRVRPVPRACLDTTKIVSFVWSEDEPEQPDYDAACWYPECIGISATKFEVRKPRPVRVACSTTEFDLRVAAEDFCTADALTVDGRPIPALWQWLVAQLMPSLQRKISFGVYNGDPMLGTGDENSMASLDYWIENAPLDIATGLPVHFLKGSVLDWPTLTGKLCPEPCDVVADGCADDIAQNLIWMIRKWWTVTKYRLTQKFGAPALGDVYILTSKAIAEALIKCAVCEAFCVDNALEWLGRTEAVDMYKRLKSAGPFDGLLPLDIAEDQVLPIMVNDYLPTVACGGNGGGQSAPVYLITEKLKSANNLWLEYRDQSEYQNLAALLGITSTLGKAPVAVPDVMKAFMQASIPSDGGRWRTITERRGDCGKVATVGEFGFVSDAPWALARIDGVYATGMPVMNCYNVWGYINDPAPTGVFGCGDGGAPGAAEGEGPECPPCPPNGLEIVFVGAPVLGGDPEEAAGVMTWAGAKAKEIEAAHAKAVKAKTKAKAGAPKVEQTAECFQSIFFTETDLSHLEEGDILGHRVYVISGPNAGCDRIVADITAEEGYWILFFDDPCPGEWEGGDVACLDLGGPAADPVPPPFCDLNEEQ